MTAHPDELAGHDEATLRPMSGRALSDERADAMTVPIGNGELVCRRR